MPKIIGNKALLLSDHGVVNAESCIDKLSSKISGDIIDVDFINQASKKGMLFVKDSGVIFDECSSYEEKEAKYKIVPTGLFLKHTKYPLLASFLKLRGKGWEGVYVGTAEQIFEMYKKYYIKPTPFDNTYIRVFCGSNIEKELVGFGLKELMLSRSGDIRAPGSEENKIECENTNEAGYMIKEIERCTEELKRCNDSNKGRHEAKRLASRIETFKTRLSKIESRKDKIDNINNEVSENEGSNKKTEEVTGNTCYIEENAVNGKLADIIKPISDEQNYSDGITKFLYSLYNRLLYKEKWMITGKYRFDFYVRNLFKLMEYQRMKYGNSDKGNGYIYSDDRSKCIINIGLLDTYGNEIFIIDNTPSRGDFRIKELSIVDSKFELLNIGFSQSDIKHLPEVFNMRKLQADTVFDANEDDFDFMDVSRLNHLIDERRSRFPDKYHSESSKVICDRIKESIIQAIKISKTDCRYVVPKYDFFRHQVQFFIPFHLDKELHDIPELVIVVGKDKDLWCIYTILPIEDAVADARILFRPTSWLREFNA